MSDVRLTPRPIKSKSPEEEPGISALASSPETPMCSPNRESDLVQPHSSGVSLLPVFSEHMHCISYSIKIFNDVSKWNSGNRLQR